MNEFRVSGRVNKISIFYKDDGNCYTKVFLSQKVPKKDKYNPFNIIYFNTNGVAEKIADEVKQGDYIETKCYLTPYEYTDNETGKTKNSINITGVSFEKLIYDDETKKFVKVA